VAQEIPIAPQQHRRSQAPLEIPIAPPGDSQPGRVAQEIPIAPQQHRRSQAPLEIPITPPADYQPDRPSQETPIAPQPHRRSPAPQQIPIVPDPMAPAAPDNATEDSARAFGVDPHTLSGRAQRQQLPEVATQITPPDVSRDAPDSRQRQSRQGQPLDASMATANSLFNELGDKIRVSIGVFPQFNSEVMKTTSSFEGLRRTIDSIFSNIANARDRGNSDPSASKSSGPITQNITINPQVDMRDSVNQLAAKLMPEFRRMKKEADQQFAGAASQALMQASIGGDD
jgi:hypothetical protein